MQTEDKAFKRGCGSKLKHETKELALIHLDTLKKKKNCRRKVKLNVYRCKFGDHWHVGRKRKEKRKVHASTK